MTSLLTDRSRTILVTGGAGYIGSVLVRRLLMQGHRVRVLDNLSFGGEALLGVIGERNFQFHQGDIRKPKDVETALEDADAVVHLAAIVGDPACKREPELATAVNRIGSELLLDKALKNGIERFVFASTCSNYGKMGSDLVICDEDSPLHPISLYAELKVEFEKRLLELPQKPTAAVCLRFATAYGLSARPRFDLTVNEFTRDLYLGQELEIYGEQFWRPYCHTTDLAGACFLALTAPAEAVAGEAFNVGATSENYRKKDLVEAILAELPERSDLVKYIRREEDPRDYRVNCDKIHDNLGFVAQRTVPDGIREIITALRDGIITNPNSTVYRNV